MARRLNLIEEEKDEFTEIGKTFLELFEKEGDYKSFFRESLIKDPYFGTMIKTIKINNSIKKQELKRSIKNLIGECSESTLQAYANLTKQYLEFVGVIEYNRNTETIKYLK